MTTNHSHTDNHRIMITNHHDDLDNSSHQVTALLRSVSLGGADNHAVRLRPSSFRTRCSSEERPQQHHLTKALKANNNETEEDDNDVADAPSQHDPIAEEDYLQDFLRWSSQLSIPRLPQVTHDCPLMPTSLTLKGVSLPIITETIANCLQRLKTKNILFAYRPHPEHAGRIEISSTQCHLKFVIQLWRKQDEKDSASSAVVVEIQRRRGCPIFMHHLRRPLFKALRTLIPEPPQEPPRKTCPTLIRGLATTRSGAISPPLVATTKSEYSKEQRPEVFPPPLRVNFA